MSGDIGNVLRTLKPRQRALLWLAYVEGMQHREIADVLGVTTPSVKGGPAAQGRSQLIPEIVQHGRVSWVTSRVLLQAERSHTPCSSATGVSMTA